MPEPEPDRNHVARRVFAGLPPRYDLLAEILSFGQNRRWRAALVAALGESFEGGAAPPGRRVLDVASGTAGIAMALRSRLGVDVVGTDLSLGMLGQGARRIGAQGSGPRIALVAGRGEQLPYPDASFDGLTFGYLLRYVTDVPGALAELARVVRPGAPVAGLDFAVPPHPLWRISWLAYTGWVLPAAGWLVGGPPWFRVGRFLGPDIRRHHDRFPPAALAAAWEAAGIEVLGSRGMCLGGGLVMWGRRRG
jgi:demethylmenaquinone methyltransferase/2-methoxy-6-polyprenyl-1,4-benzoquinol methylase